MSRSSQTPSVHRDACAPETSIDRRQGSSPFANRSFRLLFTGSTISAIGDQFTLVALPWLVLQITGDPAQLGLVLAVMALPRAVFMLVGGAMVDRMSARCVLLNARAVNAVLIGLLAGLVLVGAIRMWMRYALAFLGMAPLAAALAGGLLRVMSLTELLMGAGLSLSVIALFSLTRPSMRVIRLASAAAPVGN